MSSERTRTLVEVWQNISDVQADIKKHMHLQPDLQLLQQNPLYVSLNAQLVELRQEKARCKLGLRRGRDACAQSILFQSILFGVFVTK